MTGSFGQAPRSHTYPTFPLDDINRIYPIARFYPSNKIYTHSSLLCSAFHLQEFKVWKSTGIVFSKKKGACIDIGLLIG